MSDLEKAVVEVLEDESAIFVAAVSALPGTSKKSKKGGVKPAVSKYQAKNAAKPEETAAPVVAVDKAIEPISVALDLFSNLVSDLLGADQADLEQMTALRSEARALISKAKSINVGELQHKAEREAWDWQEQQPRDAERQIFNELKELSKGDFDVLKILQDRFTGLQDAWHHRDGDKALKEQFNRMRMAVVDGNPRMARLHEENLIRAERVMEHFEKERALQETYWQQACDKFEIANIIATLHGWPITEPKRKEVVAKK